MQPATCNAPSLSTLVLSCRDWDWKMGWFNIINGSSKRKRARAGRPVRARELSKLATKRGTSTSWRGGGGSRVYIASIIPLAETLSVKSRNKREHAMSEEKKGHRQDVGIVNLIADETRRDKTRREGLHSLYSVVIIVISILTDTDIDIDTHMRAIPARHIHDIR